MADKDPQDTEILEIVGDEGIDPQDLINSLRAIPYPEASVIEALQRAIERGKISLNSDGMVVAIRQFADAA